MINLFAGESTAQTIFGVVFLVVVVASLLTGLWTIYMVKRHPNKVDKVEFTLLWLLIWMGLMGLGAVVVGLVLLF